MGEAGFTSLPPRGGGTEGEGVDRQSDDLFAMHRHKLISAAFFAFLLATQIGNSDAKTLRYATQDEPQTLDPHSAQLAVTNRLLMNVYEGLVGRDKNFKLVPWLAVSWAQPDAMTWRFKLRPNVKFHDGAPFTADDVVFSLERILSPNSQLKSAVQGVATARKSRGLERR